MKVVGLTGGIGSGKTTVANLFRDLGISVYIADDQAKSLMNKSPEIRKKIQDLFGKESYQKGRLNRKLLASQVFNDQEKLETLNGIVHPEVERHFESWKSEQTTPYVIYEAAILFERGSYQKCDRTILVTADRQERIRRLLQRDSTTVSEIEARMANQWDDERKRKMADFIIENMDLSRTSEQVRKFHQMMLNPA